MCIFYLQAGSTSYFFLFSFCTEAIFLECIACADTLNAISFADQAGPIWLSIVAHTQTHTHKHTMHINAHHHQHPSQQPTAYRDQSNQIRMILKIALMLHILGHSRRRSLNGQRYVVYVRYMHQPHQSRQKAFIMHYIAYYYIQFNLNIGKVP